MPIVPFRRSFRAFSRCSTALGHCSSVKRDEAPAVDDRIECKSLPSSTPAGGSSPAVVPAGNDSRWYLSGMSVLEVHPLAALGLWGEFNDEADYGPGATAQGGIACRRQETPARC